MKNIFVILIVVGSFLTTGCNQNNPSPQPNPQPTPPVISQTDLDLEGTWILNWEFGYENDPSISTIFTYYNDEDSLMISNVLYGDTTDFPKSFYKNCGHMKLTTDLYNGVSNSNPNVIYDMFIYSPVGQNCMESDIGIFGWKATSNGEIYLQSGVKHLFEMPSINKLIISYTGFEKHYTRQ